MTENTPGLTSLVENDSHYLEGGTLYATDEPRTYRGLLLPWNEVGKTNLGPLKWAKGTVRIPRDTSILMANIAHNREAVVGRFTEVLETERGLEVSVRVADTDEGDALLAEIAEGRLSKLSVEIKNVVRNGAEAISGSLFGGAFVSAGAFESASLYAELAPEEPVAARVAAAFDAAAEKVSALYAEEPATEDPATSNIPTPDEDGNITVQSTATPSTVTVIAEDTETTFTPQEKETEMADATAPNTLTASAATASDKSVDEVFNLIASAKNGDSNAETLLAALSDIKHTGTGALAAPGVIQPAWLGELWAGRAYTRKYAGLVRNGDIKSINESGFVMDQGTALVKPWAGNKVELPTGTASTSLRSGTLQKWGYAADVAREYFDLPGGDEVISAFLRGLTESYAKATDEWALAQLVAGVGSTIAPATYPTDYPAVFGLLIQAAEAIEDAGDTPSFAILNQAAWDQFKYTPKDKLPEFVNFAFNIGGDVNGAGTRVVRATNIGATAAPAVIVGSTNAAHFNEKAGASPLQLDALDIARGGVDKAIIGYTQFMVDRPASLVRVGVAA